MTPVILDFPYHENSAQLFEPLACLPWAAYLDSCHPHSRQGRYDILSADPICLLITRGMQTQIHRNGEVYHSTEDPFHLLREALGPVQPGIDGIPFAGGAIGYFGYDLGRRIERIPSLAEDSEHLPEMAVGIYDWSLVVDHQQQRSWLIGRNPARLERYRKLMLRFSKAGNDSAIEPYRVMGEVSSNMTHDEYLASLAKIKRYIHDGDCYQVNFTQRFSVAAEGDSWQLYKSLRQHNAAPYAAYLSMPQCQVMSTSPERFLQVREGRVETKPIKGTAPRSEDPREDARLAEKLKHV